MIGTGMQGAGYDDSGYGNGNLWARMHRYVNTAKIQSQSTTGFSTSINGTWGELYVSLRLSTYCQKQVGDISL